MCRFQSSANSISAQLVGHECIAIHHSAPRRFRHATRLMNTRRKAQIAWRDQCARGSLG
jgi:hypothetical protein